MIGRPDSRMGSRGFMPVSISVDPESGIAVATARGVLRLEDAQEAASALWATRGWSGRSAVWDFREAEFDVSSRDTREIAEFILRSQPTPPPERIAFVTPRNADFGMARMFEVFREDPKTAFRVFREFEEAMSWAGADRPC